MRIFAINNTQLIYNKKNQNKQILNTSNLFKKENNISFGRGEKAIATAVQEFVKKLYKEQISYDIFKTPNSTTVVEFKDVQRIAKTTSFLPNGIKKILVYNHDGETPSIAYKYKKNKLQSTITFALDGRKLKKETFLPNGIRETKTSYVGHANFPKTKILFHKDGKTPKIEKIFFENSKVPREIKEYDKLGFLKTKEEYNEAGKLLFTTNYDKKGNIIKTHAEKLWFQ